MSTIQEKLDEALKQAFSPVLGASAEYLGPQVGAELRPLLDRAGILKSDEYDDPIPHPEVIGDNEERPPTIFEIKNLIREEAVKAGLAESEDDVGVRDVTEEVTNFGGRLGALEAQIIEGSGAAEKVLGALGDRLTVIEQALTSPGPKPTSRPPRRKPKKKANGKRAVTPVKLKNLGANWRKSILAGSILYWISERKGRNVASVGKAMGKAASTVGQYLGRKGIPDGAADDVHRGLRRMFKDLSVKEIDTMILDHNAEKKYGVTLDTE